MKLKNDDFNKGYDSGASNTEPGLNGSMDSNNVYNNLNIEPELNNSTYESNLNGQNAYYADPVFTQPAEEEKKSFNILDLFLKGGGGSAARPNWSAILCLIIIIIMIGSSFSCVSKYAAAKKIINDGNKIVATVTDVNTHYRRRRSNNYSVYVSYEIDGQAYNHVYVGRFTQRYFKGEALTVYYDSYDKSHVVTGNTPSKYIYAIVYRILLMVLAAVGMVKVIKDPNYSTKRLANRLTRGRFRL